MNTETAIEIGKTFLIEKFHCMNEAPGWGHKPNSYCSVPNPVMNDFITFQEICENDFGGDLDECLDVFFRRTVLTLSWFSDWMYFNYLNGFTNGVDDLYFVELTFYDYMNKCSVDDLKQILGLEVMLK
jgi:hypothetical protein